MNNININDLSTKCLEHGFEEYVHMAHPDREEYSNGVILIWKAMPGSRFFGDIVDVVYDHRTNLVIAGSVYSQFAERPQFNIEDYVVVYHPAYDTDIDNGLRAYPVADPYLLENMSMWSHTGPDGLPNIFPTKIDADNWMRSQEL